MVRQEELCRRWGVRGLRSEGAGTLSLGDYAAWLHVAKTWVHVSV